tara:strand:+ start:1160 stop:1942 length:783 start_codon:yes stop_codon:yes gene_type:complete
MAVKISVVTATYNSEATIGDTLCSLDSQTHESIEHCVIDGNSGDGTLGVLAECPKPYRCVISEKDTGIYDAMNKGVAAASGDIIGFLNSDDVYETPDVLTKVAAAFSDPNVDLVYGNLRYVDFNDTNKVIRDWTSEPYRQGMFRRGWMPPHPTVYARKHIFEKQGGFDQAFSICADWEWLYEAIELSENHAEFLDHYLVRMRIGGVSNSSFANIFKSNMEAMAAFKKHGKRVPIGFFPGKLIHRGKQFISRNVSSHGPSR